MKSFIKITIYSLALLLLASFKSYGQSEGIHWMSITDAYQHSISDSVKKKVFIDVYTHWCGWCKRMEASTFQDPGVIAYINARYYPVKLDAETRDTIHLGDKTFVYSPENKVNEVAAALLNNKMSYPTSIYLDERFNMLSPVAGYLTTEQIYPILHYYGENIYMSTTWEDYQKQYNH